MTDGTTAESSTHDPLTVASVVGPSDAGKTSLIESLVAAFGDRSVATIKSIHHDIEPDTPGTDTHRHRTAGADAVIGITPDLTFEVARGGKSADGDDTAAELAALRRALDRLTSRGFDIVLVEGFSAAPIPAIHVGNVSEKATAEEPIGTGEDSVETLRAAIEAVEPIDLSTLSSR